MASHMSKFLTLKNWIGNPNRVAVSLLANRLAAPRNGATPRAVGKIASSYSNALLLTWHLV